MNRNSERIPRRFCRSAVLRMLRGSSIIQMTKSPDHTCADYREEMILLGLRRRVEDPDISKEEKTAILSRIQELEKSLDMQ
jgi:hypothetical protein